MWCEKNSIAARATFLSVIVFLGGMTLTNCSQSGQTPNENDNSTTVNENQSVNDNVLDNDNQNDNTSVNENGNGGLNQPPVADAGEDRVVGRKAMVQLDASQSSDPDGDTLSYSWRQSEGETVSLSLNQPVKPRFTTPNRDTTLTFEVTVDDGQGAMSTDAVRIDVRAAQTPQLYVANRDGQNVVGFFNPATLDGGPTPEVMIEGNTTGIDRPVDVAIDPEGRLLTLNFQTPSISIHDDAIDTPGNTVPDRLIAGGATRFFDPICMNFDADEDLLYVANQLTNEILVFANVTSTSFDGNVSPVRSFRTEATDELNNPRGLDLDSEGNLYVANNGSASVLVFSQANQLSGDVFANRALTSESFSDIVDVVVDDDDTLYVVDGGGQIFAFDNVPSLDGSVSADRMLSIPVAGLLDSLVISAQGTMYITDSQNDAVLVFDDGVDLNGVMNPDRIIEGVSTELNGPSGLFLVDPQ